MKNAILLLLDLYSKTKVLRRPCCRFYPSCSVYMTQAIEQHGLFKGLLLGCARLLRCHPLHEGGIDEVPVRLGVNK